MKILIFCMLCLNFGCTSVADQVWELKEEPKGEKGEKQEVVVKLQAPDTTWSVNIEKIVELDNKLYVISRLEKEEGMMGAMMITTVQDSVSVDLPDLPVQHVVMGKTWNWGKEKEYQFMSGKKCREAFKLAKQHYPAPPQSLAT